MPLLPLREDDGMSGTSSTYRPADQCPVLAKMIGADGMNPPPQEFVLGKDDYGCEFKVYGATSGNYLQWDESANSLAMVGRKATLTLALGAVTSEEHALGITATGTMSSGDGFVGLNVVATASGSAASWVSGLFVKAAQASKAVNGYICAAELELNSVAANPSDHAILVLNMMNTHTGSLPVSPYIMLREYGTDSYGNCFVRIFNDTGQGGTTDATKLITTVSNNYEQNCDYAIRCMLGTTPIWLLATSTEAS